ncbi:MAG TPA: hypothetical protein VEX35_02080 [Allosphingosinicella sp.]|nr:hypothetical protein [Allosphingosinicella sp.]
MKLFLSSNQEPVANICYIADANGNPTQIDYETLKTNAKGSDPFAVPNGADPSTDQDLKNLMAARFMVGFRAQIGLPPGYAPTAIPDVVKLGQDSASVTFNLMCSEFTVVQLVPGGGYAPQPTWMNASQPSGDAWLFTSQVDLRMFATDASAYDRLPAAVKAQIENLGASAFSVQQLLFDLDNAALESVPVISGVAPGTTLYTVLQKDFLGAYFTAMQANGTPLLGATITMAASDPSTLELSNLNMEVSPFVDGNGNPLPSPTPAQQDLATLNYLCEADNDQPRPPVPFNWNWVDSAGQSDGILAINRNTFANYFKGQLAAQVANNCYAPYCRVWLSGLFDQNVHYEWNMTAGQTPTVTTPTSGQTVLQFAYSGYAEDQAGLDGDMGHLTISTTYNLSVDFVGNTIVVSQHLVVYLYVKCMATSGSGNVIDKQIIDTFTLEIGDNGQLTTSWSDQAPAHVVIDNSENPSVNPFLNFFVNITQLIADVESWLQSLVAANLGSPPLSVVQNFVFPGGNTFTYDDVLFSDNQDLAAHITYADPTSLHLSDFFQDPNRSSGVFHVPKPSQSDPR